MGAHLWRQLTDLFWLAFLAYWFFSARKLKTTKKREPSAERVVYLVTMASAYILLFTDGLNFGPFDSRFAPDMFLLDAFGVALTGAGVAFAIWARKHLGENWSATVTVKKDHELIRTGPYARVRHPIYTGMLLAMLGAALVLGEIRGLAAFAIAAMSFYYKARKEERFLSGEFGPQFAEHARQTGMFLPRLTS